MLVCVWSIYHGRGKCIYMGYDNFFKDRNRGNLVHKFTEGKKILKMASLQKQSNDVYGGWTLKKTIV